MYRLLVLFVFVFCSQVAIVHAAQKTNEGDDGVAIKGYDVVAYFQSGKPIRGSSKFEYEWAEATWRFSTSSNRDMFTKEPSKYAPQYGGFCAWAVSQGFTADVDPKAWKIVKTKLYLNFSAKIQKRWEKDQAFLITKADANWPSIRDKK